MIIPKLLQINVDELKNKLEATKTLFPEAHIIWLKELAQFLNQRIIVEVQDPAFRNKSECFPYTAVRYL